MAAQAREHHWDFARAFYLLLGIPFHAAVVYSTHHVWPVSSPEASPLLTLIADTIHSFRMPGFFILAGYFAMLVIARKGAWPWLRSRAVRLGAPLIVATATILPFQIVVSTYADLATGLVTPTNFGDQLLFRLTRFDEPWVSHLWFLYALIACCAGLAFLVSIAGARRFRVAISRLGDFAVREKWLSFTVLAVIAALLALSLPHLHALGGRATAAFAAYGQYAIYFAFGVGLFQSAEVKSWYARIGWGGLAIGLLLAELTLLRPLTVWSHAVFMICGVVAALLITGFVARKASDHFDGPNRLVRRVVDASFTIYLFHHPLIFVLALAFIPVDWPPVVEFALIVPAAAGIAYLIHALIARSPLALFLFNGVPMPGEGGSRARDARALGARR